MEEFKLIALFLSVFLLAFLLFKEVKRRNKNWLILRLIASVIAVGSLFFLIYPIRYEVFKSVKKEEFNLLTEGANLDSVSKSNAQLFTLDSGIFQNNSKNKIKFLPDLSYYLSEHPEIKTINLYGEGLENSELKKLINYKINFKPIKNINGIQNVSWQKTITNTDDLIVEGKYKNGSDKSVNLVLSGLGTNLDSVSIKANEEANFSLKGKTNQIGYFTYHIAAIQNKDSIVNEAVPFEVIEKQPVKVLILASNPDFEYKFLKDWLYQNNYALALRTRISKEKFSSDFLNLTTTNLNNLNKNLLQKFDLIIADDAELTNLSNQEKYALNSQIDEGLGLLVRIGDEKPTSTYAAGFSVNSLAVKQAQGFSFKMINDEDKTSPLTIENPVQLNPVKTHQLLVLDDKGKIYTDSKVSGIGKIAITSISNSYQWAIKGNQKDYAKYWSVIISNTIKKVDIKEDVLLKDEFPKIYNENTLLYKSDDNKTPKISVENIAIAPMQNQNFSNEWSATFWPTKSGWNKVEINGLVKQVYIFDNKSWLAANQTKKIRNTFNFIKNNQVNSPKSETITEKQIKEVSNWLFFMLFLLSCGFLWFEAKISD
ncbi:hypothetical protein A5893_08120 [Pedobacter psychrophilus]|uniref:Aerotolerance regulator N-terminal domain-containing protein n=1 Tax=Pedobacter psychrophilus TaxID=1826909 RepID=A0A179DFH1_9SPHI|nr:hypothetical protein [Pedobacter psychrophilus]OAQ39552.1 hypothetical protein A5893_08120 [Pedobacter psychrophilus]